LDSGQGSQPESGSPSAADTDAGPDAAAEAAAAAGSGHWADHWQSQTLPTGHPQSGVGSEPGSIAA